MAKTDKIDPALLESFIKKAKEKDWIDPDLNSNKNNILNKKAKLITLEKTSDFDNNISQLHLALTKSGHHDLAKELADNYLIYKQANIQDNEGFQRLKEYHQEGSVDFLTTKILSTIDAQLEALNTLNKKRKNASYAEIIKKNAFKTFDVTIQKIKNKNTVLLSECLKARGVIRRELINFTSSTPSLNRSSMLDNLMDSLSGNAGAAKRLLEKEFEFLTNITSILQRNLEFLGSFNLNEITPFYLTGTEGKKLTSVIIEREQLISEADKELKHHIIRLQETIEMLAVSIDLSDKNDAKIAANISYINSYIKSILNARELSIKLEGIKNIENTIRQLEAI